MYTGVSAALLALLATSATASPLFGGRLTQGLHRSSDDKVCSHCSISAVFGRKSYQLDDAREFCRIYIAPVVTKTVIIPATTYNPRQKPQKNAALAGVPTPSPAAHLAPEVISSACSCIVTTPLPAKTVLVSIQAPPPSAPTNAPDVFTPIDTMDELKKRGPAHFQPFGSGAIPVGLEERANGLGETRDWLREHYS